MAEEQTQPQSPEVENKGDTAEAPEAENKEEQTPSQTAEEPAQGESKEDGEKQEDKEEPEDDPIDKQLAHYKEIVEHKNRALEAEKKKNKELESKLDETSDDTPEVSNDAIQAFQDELKALKEEMQSLGVQSKETRLDAELSRVTVNAKEREAIKYVLENRIKASGNLAQDVADARMLVNQEAIRQKGWQEAMEASRQEAVAAVSGSAATGGAGGSTNVSAEEVEVLKMMTGNDQKLFEAARKRLGK